MIFDGTLARILTFLFPSLLSHGPWPYLGSRLEDPLQAWHQKAPPDTNLPPGQGALASTAEHCQALVSPGEQREHGSP